MGSVELDALREVWTQRLAAFHASGLSGVAWCAQENLPPTQLRYWKRKLAPSDAAASVPTWLAVPTVAESLASTLVVRVGPVTIEVPSGFNPDLLRAVVRTLV